MYMHVVEREKDDNGESENHGSVPPKSNLLLCGCEGCSVLVSVYGSVSQGIHREVNDQRCSSCKEAQDMIVRDAIRLIETGLFPELKPEAEQIKAEPTPSSSTPEIFNGSS